MTDRQGLAWRGWAKDATLALTVMIVAAAFGAGYVGAARRAPGFPEMPGLNQRIVGAALMIVCGRGNVTPVVPMAAEPTTPVGQLPLIEFLAGHREAIACSDVPAQVPSDRLDAMQLRSRYLLSLITGVWTATGPSWASMDWMMGFLFGISITAAYLSCRLGMPPGFALAITALLMSSALHLSNASDFRDYSKAPFFFLTVWLAGMLVSKRRSPRVVVAISAAAGCIVALGFGMRTDTGLNLIVVLVAIAGFLPVSLRTSWKLRAAAAGVCASSFLVISLPILRADTGVPDQPGSLAWHWALLGLGRDFDRALGVGHAPYELGDAYSDSQVSSVVDAFAGRSLGASGQTRYNTKAYEDAARAYYLRLVATFPADVVLRAWAALIKIVELPFADHPLLQGEAIARPIALLVEWRGRCLALFPSFAVPALVAFLAALSLRDLRATLFISFLVLFFGSYPAIQFQTRHVFHLEFVSLWILGVGASGILSVARRGLKDWRLTVAERGPRSVVVRPLVLLGAVGLVVVAPLAVLRDYQRRAVTRLLTSYEQADVQAIPISDVALPDLTIRLARGSEMFQRPRGSRSTFGDLLVVDVSGGACGLDRAGITVRYAGRKPADEFSRTLLVPVPPGEREARVFIPIYETGAANQYPAGLVLDAVEMESIERRCVTGFGRVSRPDDLPVLLTTILEDGWRQRPLHQILGGAGALRVERTVSYWEPVALRAEALGLNGAQALPLPLSSQAFDFRAPIVEVGGSHALTADGRADASGTYLAAWTPRPLDAGTVLVAEGIVTYGGLTVGLTSQGRWSAKIDIDAEGPFRAFIQVPQSGVYQVVIANHLTRGSLKNRASFSKLGVIEHRH